MKTEGDLLLHRTIFDICEGVSYIDGCYIKHFSREDDILFEEFRLKELDRAKKRGVPSDEEKIAYLINEEESWTQADENFISEQRDFIKMMIDAKSNLKDRKQIDNQDKNIKSAEDELYTKLLQRHRLVGLTRENYSRKLSEDFNFYRCFYKDKKLSIPVFGDIEDIDLEEHEVKEFREKFEEFVNITGEDSIKNAAISEDFLVEWGIADGDPSKYFGKPVKNLTNLQKKLSNYARIFRETLRRFSDIPEDVMRDPDKLLEFAMSGGEINEETSMETIGKRSSSEAIRRELDKSEGGKFGMKDVINKDVF